MSVFNSARFLAETIDSVLGQTLGDFELVVVEDHSTDGSAEILDDYARRDGRVTVIHNRPRRGLIASHNQELDAARGRYIARIDSDDICSPDRLERQVEWLDTHADYAGVAALVRIIDDAGRHCGFWADDLKALDWDTIYRTLPKANCLAHSTVMMRADVIKRFGYSAYSTGSEDYDLWLRLASAGHKIGKIPEVLVHYREHEGSLSASDTRPKPLKRDFVIKKSFLAGELRAGRFNRFDRRMALEVVHAAHRCFYRAVKPYQAFRKVLPRIREGLAAATHPPLVATGAAPRPERPALLLIVPSLGWGGAERVSVSLIQALHADYNLHLVATRGGQGRWQDRYREYCQTVAAPAPGIALTSRRALRAFFKRLVDIGRIDAVFVNNAILGYYWLSELERRDMRPPAADIQHTVGAETHRPDMMWASRLFERRVCISDLLLEHMRTLYGQNGLAEYGDRLRLVRNGIDLTRFSRALSQRSGLPANIRPGERLAIWVGRFSQEKDPLLFVETAAAFRRQGGAGVRFIMAGDGPLLDLTRRVAAQMGVSDMVEFAGYLDEEALHALLARGWLLVMTSVYEGVPLTALEALAMNVPVLSTAVGALGEVVQDGRTGVLLPPVSGFPEKAAAGIRRLVEHPDEYDAMAAAAPPTLVGKFDRETMAAGYRAIADELMRCRRGRAK